MDYSTIPQEMKNLKQWVCCYADSKVPMQASINKAASASDPTTWTDYKTALKAVLTNTYDYLGFVFYRGIVGIDIDAGYNEDGTITELAQDILANTTGWVEESRSGRGFHIYCKGLLPFKGSNNRQGVEIYSGGRFFIVTANTIRNGSPILPNDQKGIDYVLERYFSADVEKPVKTASTAFYKPQYSKPTAGKISFRPTYPVCPKGTRNHSMASLAGQLRSQGKSKREIYLEVSRANREACQPPLSDAEIQRIVTSICRYEVKE